MPAARGSFRIRLPTLRRMALLCYLVEVKFYFTLANANRSDQRSRRDSANHGEVLFPVFVANPRTARLSRSWLPRKLRPVGRQRFLANRRPLITSAPGEEVTASPGSPGSAIIARGQLAALR